MTERTKVSRKQARGIIAATFPEYRGRKVYIMVADSVTLWDLNWGGGTRNVYKGLRVSDGKVAGGAVHAAPWNHNDEGRTIAVPQGAVVVEHSISCGQDAGLTIYVNPSDAPRWLTA